jgi:hypothetical protein
MTLLEQGLGKAHYYLALGIHWNAGKVHSRKLGSIEREPESAKGFDSLSEDRF